ncbi:hypothetical protein NQ314_017929 [Rhamnusium bicolor]|uniref:Uncharacterized protein n=1 Tax=Rhamnusium bicolor TaxID=1586634 RepID=A0AAV8WTM2_9CUCU|nr:hypothetical protein NQ314_017929 [Rhamnusium bicolor]
MKEKANKIDKKVTEKVEQTLAKLSDALASLSANNAQLSDTIVKVNTSIENNFTYTDINQSNQNKEIDKDSSEICYQETNRNYVMLWKDLGGTNLHFSPGGSIHLFMKNLMMPVPDNKRISLAVNCLRSSAQDWEVLKEESVSNFRECFYNIIGE